MIYNSFLHYRIFSNKYLLATFLLLLNGSMVFGVDYATNKWLIDNKDCLNGGGRTVTHRGTSYYIYEPDLSKETLMFYFENENGQRYGSVESLNQQLGDELIFATNGGIFHPGGQPVGLMVEDGVIEEPLNTADGSGNFYLKPNGVFYLSKWGNKPSIYETTRIRDKDNQWWVDNIAYALQSGPLLLDRGIMHPDFREGSENRFVRSGVGVYEENGIRKIVFAISKSPVNFYDFALLFKDQFNCQDALYLDGNISKMYCPDLGLPADNTSFSVIIGTVPKQ